MRKPKSLRGNEIAAGSAGTPIIIGIASGARPRFISIATYKDAGNTISLQSNHFGKRQEVASPVDGTPLSITDAPRDISATDLFATTTRVGSCDYCATDLYADKAVASAISGHGGHCVMCGQGVAFKAEAVVSEATVAPAVNDADLEHVTVVGGAENRFAFDDMVLVNIDEPEDEEAGMALDKDQTAIVSALRTVMASSEAEDMGGEDADSEEDSEESEDEDEDEDGEESEDEDGEESEDEDSTDETEEDSEESEDESSDENESEDTDGEDGEEEATVSADAPAVETVEVVETPAVVTVEEPVIAADAAVEAPSVATVDDVAIDDYQAVDINTVDLSGAAIVAAGESASFVMINATPALRLDKENASAAVQALWGKPETLRQSLLASFETSEDRQATLAAFGGSVVTVPTSMRGYAAQKLATFTQKAEAEVATMADNHANRYSRAIEIAAMGTVKRSFGGSADAITTALIATLENNGVRNPQALVLAALRDAVPAFLKAVTLKANELVLASDDVLSTTAEMVGNAAFPVELPEPAPIVAQPTTVAEVAKPNPVNGKPAVIETAAPRSLTQAQIRGAVATLGLRR